MSIALRLLALVLTIGTPASAALAQDAPAAPAENRPRVEQIVVTAQRTEQSLQEVPLSVTALTGADIDDLNLRDIGEVQAISPGLYIIPGQGNSQTTLRGVAFDPFASTSPTVEFYWNDTPIESEGALRSLFDTHQIEVVKGPQATLRGGSSPSGVITIVSRRPNLEKVDGFVEAQLSDNAQRLIQGAIGAPLITGKVGLRIAGEWEKNNGDDVEGLFTSDQSTKTRAARITLLARPSESFEASLVYQYLKVEDRLFEDVASNGGPTGPGLPVLERFSRTALVEFPPKFSNELNYAIANLRFEALDHAFSLTGSWNKNQRNSDRDLEHGNIIPNFGEIQRVRTEYPIYFGELRAESIDREFWNYMVGAEFRKADTETQVDQFSRSYFNFLAPFGVPGPFPTDGPLQLGPPQFTCFFPPNRPCNLVGYSDVITDLFIPASTRDIAVFTRQTFDFTDALRLEFGVRYRDTEGERESPLTVTLPQLFATVNSDLIPLRSRETDDEVWTGSVSLSYRFTDDLLAFASWGRGWRAGASTIVTTTFPPGSTAPFFDEEKNDGYEFGLKSTLFGDRLRANASLFYQKFDDYQSRVPSIAVDGDGDGCFGDDPGSACPEDGSVDGFVAGLTFNAPAVVKGVELELNGVLTDHWTAWLGTTYAKAEFDSGAKSPCNRLNAAGFHVFQDPGGDPAGSFGVSTCSRSGPLGNIPRWTISGGSEYVIPFERMEAYVRGFVRYNGRHRNDTLLVPRRFDDYALLNLYLGVRSAERGWDVALWAKNLFDKDALIDVTDPLTFSVFSTGYSGVNVNRGRELGVTLRYNFSL